LKVRDFVDQYFSKDDLQEICELEGLGVSGEKDLLVKRLRDEASYSVLDFLWYLLKDDLKEICDDMNLRVGGTAEDLRMRILKYISETWGQKDWENEKQLVEQEKSSSKAEGMKQFKAYFLEIYPGGRTKAELPIQSRSREEKTSSREQERFVDKSQDLVEQLVNYIHNWKQVAPPIAGKQRERAVSMSLTGFLSGKYSNIELEKKFESTRIDAVINKIGIEAKYRPDQNEINRLYGQIDDYLRYLDHIVVVFIDTDQPTVNNFRRKITTGGYQVRVTIVQA